jgi:UDP-N-acetylmuramate--alanine ligase
MSATQLPWSGRRLHLIGLGGAGMSGYALAANALGAQISGSDQAASPYSERLREQTGIETIIGHRPSNVPDGDDVEVFYSSAIGADNPERRIASERALEVRPRADLLGELSRLRRTIAVAGAHGKTTTACMITHVLNACGMDPSYLIGGVLGSTGTNAAWGQGEWLVIEADESDRSMLSLRVEIAVLTNVELDHHATFGSLRELEDAFRVFLAGAPSAVIWNRPELLALRDGECVAYEVEGLELRDGGSRFQWHGSQVRLPVPGAHNARNATGALEAALIAGAEPAAARASLSDFRGATRRFQLLGRHESGALIYDDYAHHPTEVTATLSAARTMTAPSSDQHPPARLIVAFQPHLFSRTKALADEFAAALTLADVIVVLDVYGARERPDDWPGISGRLIADAAKKNSDREVRFAPSLEEAERALRGLLTAEDLLIVMGAGNVDALGRALVRS